MVLSTVQTVVHFSPTPLFRTLWEENLPFQNVFTPILWLRRSFPGTLETMDTRTYFGCLPCLRVGEGGGECKNEGGSKSIHFLSFVPPQINLWRGINWWDRVWGDRTVQRYQMTRNKLDPIFASRGLQRNSEVRSTLPRAQVLFEWFILNVRKNKIK